MTLTQSGTPTRSTALPTARMRARIDRISVTVSIRTLSAQVVRRFGRYIWYSVMLPGRGWPPLSSAAGANPLAAARRSSSSLIGGSRMLIDTITFVLVIAILGAFYRDMHRINIRNHEHTQAILRDIARFLGTDRR